MVFESLLFILLVEKEQKISLFKCLFKFEKIEQVDNFEKEIISLIFIKRRMDNLKQNVLDNKDIVGFKDVIGNMKVSFKIKLKDVKLLVLEKESINIY